MRDKTIKNVPTECRNFRKYFDGVRREEEAMMRHYIITHPELFPEPKKVKFIDEIQPWRPNRH